MEPDKRLILCVAVIAIFALITSGCAEEDASNREVSITVSASATLTEAFEDIAEQFILDNPDINVRLNMADSGSLVMQIERGAPIDVFASASWKHMDRLCEKDLVDKESRVDFAQNSVVLIVPYKSQLEIKGQEDITKHGVDRIAVGNPQTTAVGEATKEVLVRDNVWETTREKTIFAENVKQALIYVERGEVDAGFVFITDAMTAKPESIRVIYTLELSSPATYPIAIVSGSENKEEALKFIDFVTGEKGRSILEGYGFQTEPLE